MSASQSLCLLTIAEGKTACQVELGQTPEAVAASGYTGEAGGRVKTSPGIPKTNLDPSPCQGEEKRARLPSGHRFFPDNEREAVARSISWAMEKGGDSALFTTLTFKDYVSPYRGKKMVKRWLARAEQALKDKRGDSLKSFCALEWQKRDVIHYHLLLIGRGLDALSRKRLEHRWEAIGGGFARCYEADREAAPYLAKYTSKSLGGDVEWGGTWQGLRYPASVSRVQAPALTSTG